MTITNIAMKVEYLFFVAFCFGVILTGCCDFGIEPRYFPPLDGRITIRRIYDDQFNRAGSALSVEATFHDKFVGRVSINDDTIPMLVSTRDQLTIVTYSSVVPAGYRGSIDFDNDPLHLQITGSGAFPYVNLLFATPVKPEIIAPAVNDTIRPTGCTLRWNAFPEDTTQIHIDGRISLDTLVVGVDSLRVGPEIFQRFAGRSNTDIQLRLSRSMDVQKVNTDSSKMYVRFEAEVGRNLIYKP
jgi:hypothetical protein